MFPPAGPTRSSPSDPDPSRALLGLGSSLTVKCCFYLTHGLALLTRKAYSSAERRFVTFCIQDNRLHPSGSALPASQETFLRFCTHLADTLRHSSIKVYLSAVTSLHIDHGLPDLLAGCLQLQRILWGIKRHQGSNQHKRQLITNYLMLIIHRSLDLSVHNHSMLWVACCIGFFGFLGAGEFTVNAPFDPAIHLTVNDIQVDSLFNPQSFRIVLKCLKTNPFRQGCYIYIGTGRQDLCPVHASS